MPGVLFLKNAPPARLYITVLVLRLLTENLQYPWVIKNQPFPADRKRCQAAFSNHSANALIAKAVVNVS